MHTRTQQWINRYSTPCPLGQVDPARPVAMHLARTFGEGRGLRERFTLIVGDYDTSRPGGRTAVEEQAAHLTQLAAAYGVPAVTAESGPSGGLHVWMSVPEGVAVADVAAFARAAAALWSTFDGSPLFNPFTGAARPPGAAHRHGGHSRLRSHTLDAAIQALKTGASVEAFTALAAAVEALAVTSGRLREGGARTPGDVVPASLAYDRNGRLRPVVREVTTDQDGRVRLDSPRLPMRQVTAAALGRALEPADQYSDHAHYVLRLLAAEGNEFADALTLARTAPGLEYLRTERTPTGREPRTDKQTRALAERLWWLAVQDAARRPVVEALREGTGYGQLAAAVADLLARIEAAGPDRWARQSGPADLACLRAVAWLMLTSGSPAVTAACRRLAVLMGYHHSTAAQAVDRVVRDGWLKWETQPVAGTRTAGRLALADAHECPQDDEDGHHVCAVYTLADPTTGEISAAGQAGSDRRRNAAPPPHTRHLSPELRHHLTHHQADLWHHLGHHCGRSLEAIQQGARTPAQITARTGYRPATTARHIEDLRRAGIVAVLHGTTGARVMPTGRSLWQAAEQVRPGLAGRIAGAAVRAIVDAYVTDWWHAEVAWCRLDALSKRRRGRRRSADQGLIPTGDRRPDPRAYPRKGKTADHGRARQLAEQALNAPALRQQARQLAERGALVDPGALIQAPDAAATA